MTDDLDTLRNALDAATPRPDPARRVAALAAAHAEFDRVHAAPAPASTVWRRWRAASLGGLVAASLAGIGILAVSPTLFTPPAPVIDAASAPLSRSLNAAPEATSLREDQPRSPSIAMTDSLASVGAMPEGNTDAPPTVVRLGTDIEAMMGDLSTIAPLDLLNSVALPVPADLTANVGPYAISVKIIDHPFADGRSVVVVTVQPSEEDAPEVRLRIEDRDIATGGLGLEAGAVTAGPFSLGDALTLLFDISPSSNGPIDNLSLDLAWPSARLEASIPISQADLPQSTLALALARLVADATGSAFAEAWPRDAAVLAARAAANALEHAEALALIDRLTAQTSGPSAP